MNLSIFRLFRKNSLWCLVVGANTSSASADENDRLLRIDEAARRLNPSGRG